MEMSGTAGILLLLCATAAVAISNSPWRDAFHHFWETPFTVGFGAQPLGLSLHHWINDGLMSLFFFAVGLELKREIMAGELSSPSKAALPVAAAAGGMILPALIYLLLNPASPASAGWGIPMATDIAFALGILHLLGDRVPLNLKIFLTALAIADDIGAVLVIAFFYTSEIDLASLAQAGAYLALLATANRLGVRSSLFYGIVGIGGVWMAFLLSGVHATIAAVLIAFTIPATVKVDERDYAEGLERLLARFKEAEPNDITLVTNEQLHIVEDIRDLSKQALTPLQRLEHGLHPLVSFVIMPLFALSNAGVALDGDVLGRLAGPVSMGVALGLLAGKFGGIMAASHLFLRMGWARLPEGVSNRHLTGAAVLAGIGFTMSLFISDLAFDDAEHIMEARLGILFASVTAGLIGYALLKKAAPTPPAPKEDDDRQE